MMTAEFPDKLQSFFHLHQYIFNQGSCLAFLHHQLVMLKRYLAFLRSVKCFKICLIRSIIFGVLGCYGALFDPALAGLLLLILL